MSSQQSQQSNWSDEALDLQLPKVNNVMKSLNVSPLRSQLKSNIKSAKPSTIRYYKRKAEETIHNMLDLIAPSQGKVLKKEVISKDSIDQEASLVDTLIKMYENTFDNSLKSQILSVLSIKKTKVELQHKIPGLTQYRIDQARGIFNKTASHRLEIKEKLKTYRHKMDSAQVEHAMGFFSDPAFMQLVSYGTREIQLDSGERLTIPEVIRTSCHSKIVEMYLSYCEDTGFTPLSKSSLFRILNSCEAKKRTNLHGLDNITADGIDAFESLLDLTKCFKEDSILSTEQYDEMTKNIRDVRSYLKSDYKLHLEKDSLCADHCLNWLLSDPNMEEFKTVCNHEHTLTCDRCEILKSIEKKIDTIISQIQNGDKKDEVKKKFTDAMVNVHGWKSHIIRTVNQDLFRIEVLENLRPNEGVLVMDWAMKFLPMRHREKQTDWFGQRGIHWHVSVLIYRTDDGEIGHRTFTHVLERVKQDWYAVASLLDHVLTTVRKQLPQISEVYIRSDNAGCYHCGNLWLAIPKISEITGIKVRQYCYSEAQAGKSYCDSKIAHMRTKMRSYVANGKDILSANDMKTAIDHGSGVTGCQVASVIIDTRYNITKNHQLKNVSLYNDVMYLSSNEMILKKQFNVGIGMKVFESTTQKRFGCNIIRDFDVPNKVTGQIKLKQNVDVAGTCEIPITIPSEVVQDETALGNSHISQIREQEYGYQFPCPEIGCTKSFASHRTLDQHLITGKHDIKLYRESTYDLIKKQWAELCNNVVIVFHKNKQSVSQNTEPMNIIGMGYGLKKQKKINRFSPSVKLYLEQKFKEGEQSGKKYLPKDIEIEMRNLKDSNGNRVFPINDCLNSTQILSFFSRLSSKSFKCEDN